MRQCKGDLENKTGDLKALQGQIDRYRQDISKTEGQLRDQKVLQGLSIHTAHLYAVFDVYTYT